MNCHITPRYSLYLSRYPVDSDGQTYDPDINGTRYLPLDGLMYICSDVNMTYVIDYPQTTYVVPKEGSEETIVIDGMTGSIGKISISGIRQGSEDTGSNRWFDKQMESIISDMQFTKNAHLLRIYNTVGSNKKGHMAIDGNNYVTHTDLYVFVKNYRLESHSNPNLMNISLTLIERNAGAGLSHIDINNIYSYEGV